MNTLDSIPATAAFLQQLPFDEIPFVLGEVERVRAILWARLAQGRSPALLSKDTGTTCAHGENGTEATESNDPERLLTVAHAADLLSLSRSTIYQLMDSGQLAYVKIGRTRRIARLSLSKLTKKSRTGGWAE